MQLTRGALLLSVFAVGCIERGLPVEENYKVNVHGDDAGDQLTGCKTDVECGGGQVCVNCEGDGVCTPGCRDRSQCQPLEICQLGTVCQQCPCAPGWCIIDPCRDVDGDGYVPTAAGGAVCPGKQFGDCNDAMATVNPGAPELCNNYRDDNCDGRTDEADALCVCGADAGLRCNSTFDCGAVGELQCSKGCCTPCTEKNQAGDCDAQGYCEFAGGNNANGCGYGTYCSSCGPNCNNDLDPVCGRNGTTYRNRCLAGRSGVALQHDGGCVDGEGIICRQQGNARLDGGCGTSGMLYCRDTCGSGTSCPTGTCALVGT